MLLVLTGRAATAQNPEMIGVLTEALNAEFRKPVATACYDAARTQCLLPGNCILFVVKFP